MLLQKKSLILALTLLSWLLGGSQFIRRSVVGWVTDQRGNPIAGAAVQMENTMDLRVRSFITQTDGHYYFDGLSDDIDYTLKARYFNYWSQPKTLSKFDSSIHARVNLVITIDGSTRPMSSLAPSMRMGEAAAEVALNGAKKIAQTCIVWSDKAVTQWKQNHSIISEPGSSFGAQRASFQIERSAQMSPKDILFPVDFSEHSHAIIPHVRAACERFNSSLTLLHIVHAPLMAYGAIDSPVVFDYPLDEMMDSAEKSLQEFAAASFPGISVNSVVKEGDPALCIADLSKVWKNDLIMMPTRGRGPFRAALLGSVTAKVLHDATCAVWTDAHCVETGERHTGWRKIVCAIDTEPQAEAVRLIRYAADLSKERGVTVYLAHAVPSPEARQARYMASELTEFLKDTARSTIAAMQAEAGTQFRVCLEAGGISEVVGDAASSHEADLVLIGRGVLPEFAGRLRSHVYSLVRDMPCPVLSV